MTVSYSYLSTLSAWVGMIAEYPLLYRRFRVISEVANMNQIHFIFLKFLLVSLHKKYISAWLVIITDDSRKTITATEQQQKYKI